MAGIGEPDLDPLGENLPCGYENVDPAGVELGERILPPDEVDRCAALRALFG